MKRKSEIIRKTNETDIKCKLSLDGSRDINISTGIGFLDHLLELMCFHGKLDLELSVTGDLYIDDHHTVEDVGIVLGQAFKAALGDKKGIERYANELLPMDESLSRVVIDICNRSCLVYQVEYKREKIGSLDTQNIKEFFRSFVNEANITLHITSLYGENAHHIAEGIFKALGRCLSISTTIKSDAVQSSKGML